MQSPTLKAKYRRMFLILTIQTQMAEVRFLKSLYPLSIMIKRYIIKTQGNRGFSFLGVSGGGMGAALFVSER